MLNKEQLDKVHETLAKRVERYVEAIKETYGEYIPDQKLEQLENIEDYKSVVRIFDFGSINGYATNDSIMIPLCADKVMSTLKMIPGFGMYKNHKLYTDDTLIINNNTFVNYVMHLFVTGQTVEGYYEDLLLHETMHFCGGDGASALKEGLNELLTRKIAKKYGFRTSACGYPKEVKVVYELEKIFSEEVMNQIAFINDPRMVDIYLREKLGDKAAKLYHDIEYEMEKEFNKKYYRKMDSFNGLTGVLKKIICYKRIDYKKIYKMIDEYKKEEKKLVK